MKKEIQAQVRRVYLHRALWHMRVQRLHMVLGGVISAIVAYILVFHAKTLWAFQGVGIKALLHFAKVPTRVINLPALDISRGIPVYYHPGGETFIIPIKYQALSSTIAISIVLFLVLIAVVAYYLKFIPLPFKIVIMFLVALSCATILYTSFVSPLPPHTINRIALDWQYSGAVVLLLIAIIFTFSIFPVKGPLWVKLMWLGITLVYSIAWNTVRISAVLATFFHLGSVPFLLAHYLAGLYIDFIYVVAFYSLALAHLAQRETSEVGW